MLNIPKPNFTLRYGLETSISDRAVYHGICSYLSQHFDSLIPWFVFSHRRDAHRKDGRYMFRKGTDAWRDFVGAVRSSVTPASFLLTTDISNYFEHIDLRKLRLAMNGQLTALAASASEKNKIRAYIAALFDCLENWTYEPERGLPQNRDASSFLANLYMLAIDNIMTSRGYTYYRYMDDIKIVCSTQFEARRALKELSLALRDIGLSVNSKKTNILSGQETKEISDCLDGGSPEVEHLDAVWSTRKRGPISRSFPMLKQFTEQLLRDGRIDSREFRYCINRLIVLATCTEFAVPDAYFSAITTLVIDRLSEFPASCDYFCKYLRVVPLTDINLSEISAHLRDDTRNFYTWQSYRLWMLLGQRGARRDELVAEALRLTQGGTDNASRAGAAMYLGAVGNPQERLEVARGFSTLNTFLGQRCALIAIQEVPYKPHVRDHVQPHVRVDLQGVYRNLTQIPTRYFSPVERVSLTSFVDAERDYA